MSFHFFVNWSSLFPTVADQIWMTRQLRFDSGVNLESVHDADVLNIFNSSPAGRKLDQLEVILSSYGYRVAAVLLPEIHVSAISDETPVWIIVRSGGMRNRIKKITISLLKDAIQKHSGGPVRVGSKGLIYGTSAVECYLSRSDAAFPGDADAVIIDNQNRVRSIVEYKKHTLSTAIGEHLVTQYYPRPDGRKYQRLAALANRCENVFQERIPLIVLYYSTKKPIIRLQEIGSLDNYSLTISRDTRDISTRGRPTKEVSDDVVRWLGVC